MAIKFSNVKSWLRYQYRKAVRPKVVTNGRTKVYLGDQATTRYARAIYRDSHEAEERGIVQRNLEDSDIVLECGAGLGVVTVLCCQQIGSDRVYTFEANPRLEPILRQMFELNKVSPNLEMKMVSLAGGEGEFFVADRFVGSSRYAGSGEDGREKLLTTSVSIQELIKQIRPTFLIMDIEGAEVDLASQGLDLCSIQKLCIEMHPKIVGDEAISQVVGRLLHQGFTLRLTESHDDVLYFSRAA